MAVDARGRGSSNGDGFGDQATVSGSRPLRRSAAPAGGGSGRGARPLTAVAMALMWAGVEPQQPPRRLTHPLAANSASVVAISAGVSSYAPKALGRPALG